MGANQSHSSEARWRDSTMKEATLSRHGGTAASPGNNMKAGHSQGQGKPVPPHGVPIASDITHNSLVLTWQPPKSASGIIAYMVEMYIVQDEQWTVVTRSCQGNTYKVRNLIPDSAYRFRIRAENIYGRGKSGDVSDIVQTSSFDVHGFPSPSEDKTLQIKRRHSLNTFVPVEGRVASILNHSHPVIETTPTSSKDEPRNNTLQREGLRSSLQNTKKRSGSSLIPGTKTNSLVRLRTSQSKLPNSSEDIKHRSDSKRSSLTESIEKLDHNGDSDAKSDIGSECNTESQSSGSEYLVRDQHDINEDDVDGDHRNVSNEIILSAPVCDDIKIALYSKKLDSYSDEKLRFVSDEGIDTTGPTTDFRTLRSMLQSSDVIIKPTQSLPEISDVCRGKSIRTSQRHKLSTIVDEEDDDSVRVTTL